MANNKILYIVIGVLVLVILGGGVFFFLNNKGAQKESEANQQATTSTSTVAAEEEMVDCGQSEDPWCFVTRMNGCLPVTAKMMGSDGTTAIEMTIFGVENEKCHFQRKINNVADLDCYFPKGTLNMDTLDQTFGNEKGLQKVVDDACTRPGW